MGPLFVAALFAIGAATWVYTKLQQQTGYGNSQNALIGAGVVGIVLFIAMFATAKMIGL